MTKEEASLLIKEEAYKLGFGACGIAQVATADTEALYFDQWIAAGHHASMQYMENYRTLRLDPSELIPNARSIISVALNYYPTVKQPTDAPQIAYYAYGEDYHIVLKEKLRQLQNILTQKIPLFNQELNARCFTDSAPLLERYWAWKAGLGWIGKNSNLIIPNKGSFFFLGELVVDTVLAYDTPIANKCGSCTKCMDACPTGALEEARCLNANKCLSYLTIEHKGDIPEEYAVHLDKRLYGCDTCQTVCPWNRFATGSEEPAFQPKEVFFALKEEDLPTFTREQYQVTFKNSAIKRAKYEGILRNIRQRKKEINTYRILYRIY